MFMVDPHRRKIPKKDSVFFYETRKNSSDLWTGVIVKSNPEKGFTEKYFTVALKPPGLSVFFESSMKSKKSQTCGESFP